MTSLPPSLLAHVNALVDGSVNCVALLDRAFNFLRVNQAYAAADRRAVEDFVGRNHFDMYPSDARAIFERVVATREPFRAEARPFRYAGAPERGVTYWDIALTPILDGHGDVECLLLSLTDVTGHIRAQHQLQKSGAQLGALADKLQARIDSERAHLARELRELVQELTVIHLGLREAACDSGPLGTVERICTTPWLCAEAAPQLTSPPAPHERLSVRERQVLRQLAAGRRMTEIAVDLGVSVKTVSTYRQRMMEKLQIDTTAAAIRYAVEQGLLDD